MTVLAGKVAIVTGAGQGVGEGIALALAEAGTAVALVGRTEAKLQRTAQKIRDRGGVALPLQGDICLQADIDRVTAATLAEFGAIDVLVNNAQIIHMGTLDDLPESAYFESMDSGPLATLRFMKAVRPHMTARGGGTIVNLASSATHLWNTRGMGIYAAAKQAIRALTRAAACEWGAEGIRVNVISPTAMTPAMEKWLADNPAAATEAFKNIPLGRLGDSELDIGRVVVFLASPAASYITGLTLPLDGGQAVIG